MTTLELLQAEKEAIVLSQELEILKGAQDNYIKDNKLEFWEPWAHQQKALDYIYNNKKIILVQGSNQIGKTILGVCVCGSVALGVQLWDGRDVTDIYGKPPVKIRILCADWEHHAKEVIVPKLEEWIPRGVYETSKNNVGVDAFWKFKNGSTIELLTHTQETKSQEGWTGHFIWADEPFPRSKYSANKRGLLINSGVFLITMTAVYEPWIKKEIVNKPTPATGLVLSVPMNANPLLKEEDIKEFELACSEEEREARVHGGWLQMSGLVVPEFDPSKHIIDKIKVSPDWPVIGLYDFHPGKPQAVSFFAIDKYDRIYVIHEIWENLSPEEIADEVIRLKNTHNWRLENFLIDPLAKGDTAYIKKRGIDIPDTFTVIKNKLISYGINTDVATKDVSGGVANLRAAFKNIMPTMFICRNCEKTIEQLETWVKDRATGKPLKGKDIEDHFCENLYRSTLTGVVYTDPKMWSEPLKYNDIGIV